MPEIDSKPALKCDFCGFAIFQNELAFEFSGRAVDFVEKVQMTGAWCLCAPCRDRVLGFMKEDQSVAIKRREEAFGVGK